MYRVITLLSLLISFSSQCTAQDQFSFLKCRGELPDEFTQSDYTRFGQDLEDIGFYASDHDTKYVFTILSNLAVKQLLESGQLIYGDSVTKMVNAFKDEALAGHPKAKSRMRVYLSHSIDRNAYCLNNGIVILNLGLLASIKDHRELAFILCHEFSHYILSHSIKKLDYAQIHIPTNSDRAKGEHKKKVEDLFRYTRSLEQEADSLGYLLYRNFGFSDDHAHNALRLLSNPSYSYIDNKYKKPEVIEKEGFPVPAYLLKTVFNNTNSTERTQDEYKTHKDIEDRVAYLKSLATELGDQAKGELEARPTALHSFSQFLNHIRCQNTMDLLAQGRPNEAMWNASVLSQLPQVEQEMNVALGISLTNILTLKSLSVLENYINYPNGDHEFILKRLEASALAAMINRKVDELAKETINYQATFSRLKNMCFQASKEMGLDSKRFVTPSKERPNKGKFWTYYGDDWLSEYEMFEPKKKKESNKERYSKDFGMYTSYTIEMNPNFQADQLIMFKPQFGLGQKNWSPNKFFRKNVEETNRFIRRYSKSQTSTEIEMIDPLRDTLNYQRGFLLNRFIQESNIYPASCFYVSDLSPILKNWETQYLATVSFESYTGGPGWRLPLTVFNLVYPLPALPLLDYTDFKFKVYDLQNHEVVFTGEYLSSNKYQTNMAVNQMHFFIRTIIH